MAQQKPEVTAPRFNLGDRVKIRFSGGLSGRIIELRGPLGPGGVQVCRVVVGRRPLRRQIELMEDQLVLVPAKS
jgi:hypothetical protein